jgi:ornithine cyclodeaminase
VAILGAGVQARSHVAAMRAVLDDPEIRIWARNPDAAQALAAEVGAVASPSPDAALLGAEVVCTTTSAAEPIVELRWLAEGAHVNAVGSSIPTTRELDTATVAASSLFVDRRESTLNEAGDYLLPAAEGAVGPDHIKAELGEVLTGTHPGRQDEAELTIFKSLGIAVEDLAAAELVVRRARERGVGAEVEF